MLQSIDKNLTPRRLIVSLFNTSNVNTLTIGQLISAGALFDFEASSVRMAVTRLIKDQLICSVERGVYCSGKEAEALYSEIQRWRTADKEMKPWQGDWLLALTGHLGRTNKSQLRSMTRAFQLYGFAEIELGVWIRPANLIKHIDEVYQNLLEIGVREQSYLVTVNEIASHHHRAWLTQWPAEKLQARYRETIDRLNSSRQSFAKMTTQEAARESLLLGEAAIRLINLDPLLPREIIDTDEFQNLVSCMLAYDELGQFYWQTFLAS